MNESSGNNWRGTHIFTRATNADAPDIVETLSPPFFFGPTVVLPAVLFLGWWFLLQFFNGTLSLGMGGPGLSGVAWWAHVWGFLFGFVVSLLAKPPRRPPPRIIDI